MLTRSVSRRTNSSCPLPCSAGSDDLPADPDRRRPRTREGARRIRFQRFQTRTLVMTLKRCLSHRMVGLGIFLALVACSANDIDYTPPPGNTETAITHYSFGRMVTNGKTHGSDVAILPGGNIRRCSFEVSSLEIAADHLNLYISDQVQTIIIGTGYGGRAALTASAKDVVEKLRSKGVRVHITLSSRAVVLYNASPKEGLLAFFHLNC